MDLGLQDKTVMVAAASKGLGKAIALQLAQEGAQVAICSRDEKVLSQTAKEIREETQNDILAIQADVTRAEDCEKFVIQTYQHYGSLYGLVCNAGGPPAGTFSTLTDEQWNSAVALNLMSVVRLVRASIPYIQQSGGGRIVNLASSSVKQPIAGLVLSNSIRLGLQGLIKSLSDELAPDILINTVSPGRFDTDRLRSLDVQKAEKLQQSYAAIRLEAEREIPLKRYGKPEEFARYVAFLVSPINTYMTGQHVLIDGGLTRSI